MSVKTLGKIDDVDTRREIVLCLQKLSVNQRIEWLHYCCRHIGILGIDPGSGNPIVATISCPTGDICETYLDFFALVSGFGLDPKAALEDLERRAACAGQAKLYVPD